MLVYQRNLIPLTTPAQKYRVTKGCNCFIQVYLENQQVHIVLEQLEKNLYQFYYQNKKMKRYLPDALIARIIL